MDNKFNKTAYTDVDFLKFTNIYLMGKILVTKMSVFSLKVTKHESNYSYLDNILPNRLEFGL